MSTADCHAPTPDADIARLLACHYGDGAVYLPSRAGARRDVLQRAMAAGFVSIDGFITRRGRQLLARFDF